jgi:DNA replication protein DnaC
MKGKAAHMSLRTFDQTERRHMLGYGTVVRWLDDYPHEEGESVYLWSKGYGAGKTHLAKATQRWIIQAGGRVLLRVLPEVLAEIRQSYRPDSELSQATIIHRMQTTDTLILDDLGRGHVREASRSWLADIMYLVINARYNAALSMLVTSNVGPDTIRDVIGGASASRLMEMVDTRICDMSGEDWRMRT